MKIESQNRVYDLEERLINFSLKIMEIVEQLPNTRAGNHVAGQLLRSGTSPSLNYGEAQVAESRNDFIHKMKICVKELKETGVALHLIIRKPMVEKDQEIELCLDECIQLTRIFMKSIETAKQNN